MKMSDIIVVQNIPFKEISKREVKKLPYRKIMFIQHARFGAMGYSGKNFFLLKNGNDIEGRFCSIMDFSIEYNCKENGMLYCENFLPICYTNKKNRMIKYWKRINMGAGNSLYLRRKFADKFQKRAETRKCAKIPFIYGNWAEIAYEILQEDILRKHNHEI